MPQCDPIVITLKIKIIFLFKILNKKCKKKMIDLI